MPGRSSARTLGATQDLAAVLAANQAFYTAFAARDAAAMTKVWATHLPVICIHPGWAPLLDRDEMILSWQRIFANPDQPDLRTMKERAFLLGDFALVVCLEVLPSATLVATNTFAREDGQWRMVHHQSSALSLQSLEEEEPPAKLRN
jgi:ketosteroid isomerase-like protein